MSRPQSFLQYEVIRLGADFEREREREAFLPVSMVKQQPYRDSPQENSILILLFPILAPFLFSPALTKLNLGKSFFPVCQV
jgi:hypothetical protein